MPRTATLPALVFLGCFLIACLPCGALAAADTPTSFVTFIVPTLGRPSLDAAIKSLQSQTDSDWEAILVLDGWFTHHIHNVTMLNTHFMQRVQTIAGYMSDKRIHVLSLPRKLGHPPTCKYSCSGAVRNIAMAKVTSPWVAFLDDDDLIRPQYVEVLRKEATAHADVSAFIFRMALHGGQILPDLRAEGIGMGGVGISFSFKAELCAVRQLCFESHFAEDYLMLKKLQDNGLKLKISPHILYLVKGAGADLPLRNGTEVILAPQTPAG